MSLRAASSTARCRRCLQQRRDLDRGARLRVGAGLVGTVGDEERGGAPRARARRPGRRAAPATRPCGSRAPAGRVSLGHCRLRVALSHGVPSIRWVESRRNSRCGGRARRRVERPRAAAPPLSSGVPMTDVTAPPPPPAHPGTVRTPDARHVGARRLTRRPPRLPGRRHRRRREATDVSVGPPRLRRLSIGLALVYVSILAINSGGLGILIPNLVADIDEAHEDRQPRDRDDGGVPRERLRPADRRCPVRRDPLALRPALALDGRRRPARRRLLRRPAAGELGRHRRR